MLSVRMLAASVSVAFFGLSLAFDANAHITLQTKQARVDSHYKAVLRVPHGCDGTATVKLRVQIPAGVIDVKPQPKPGWTLNIVRGEYKHAYSLYGAKITSGVRELSWTGNLPDDEYDEFVFVGYLSDALKPGTKLYFPVVQECKKGVTRWIDHPVKGEKHGEEGSHPAPSLDVLPKR